MAEAIVKGKNRILPCAAYLQGEYGFNDIYLGVPCKLGEGGLKEVIEVELTDDERAALTTSADHVRSTLDLLKSL
jgi:malate dehydrogenase